MTDREQHWGTIPDAQPKRISGHVRKPRATTAQVRAWAAAIREQLGWNKPGEQQEARPPPG